MNIEIRNIQLQNKGAALMLCAIIQKLKSFGFEYQLVFQTSLGLKKHEIEELGGLSRLNLRKRQFDFNWLTYLVPKSVRDFIKKRYKLITSADIDAILDASGFAYGAQWSDIVLAQVAKEVEFFSRLNKPYIFLPQSFGPFETNKQKVLAEKMISHASLMFVRDKKSEKSISALVQNASNVYFAHDFTNTYRPKFTPAIKDYIVIVPNSKMLSPKNPNQRWIAAYEPLLVDISNQLLRSAHQVVILNHGGIEDERLCQSLADKVPSAILIQPENADETKAIIAKAKACVSSRYHACISALSNGVPCLATSWSHKYQELYNEYECPSYVLEPFTDDFELDKSLGHLLNPHPIIKEGLMACSKDIQLQTQQMWKLVHKALLEYQQNR